MPEQTKTIGEVLDGIYEAQTGLILLGNIVDRYETDQIPFEINGAGDLILEQAKKIHDALETLEEVYHLNDLSAEIKELLEKREQRRNDYIQRIDQRLSVREKYKQMAEEEIEREDLN
jgi:pyridoxal/pyridoxine/pyridoxamine kinase